MTTHTNVDDDTAWAIVRIGAALSWLVRTFSVSGTRKAQREAEQCAERLEEAFRRLDGTAARLEEERLARERREQRRLEEVPRVRPLALWQVEALKLAAATTSRLDL